MIPIAAKLAALGLGAWALFGGKKKPQFQSMSTVGANGKKVTVMTPVPDAVTSAQATATATTATTGLPVSASHPAPSGVGQTFAPPGAITQIAPGLAQLAPIVITPDGASSTAIGSVIDVQRALNTLGFQPTLKEDGILGPNTIANIKAFQAKSGLVVDGNAGPATKAAVSNALVALSGGASVAGATAANSNPQSGSATTPAGTQIDTTSALAMSNTAVQHALNVLGASPQLTEDGILGPMSIAAIKSFQTSHGLTPDGIAGPKTKTALYVAMQPSTVTANFGFGAEKKYPHIGFSPGEWWKIAHPNEPWTGKLTKEQDKEYNKWRFSSVNPYGGMSPAEWWHAKFPGQPYPSKLSKSQFEQYLSDRYQLGTSTGFGEEKKKYPHIGFSPSEWWKIARPKEAWPGKLSHEQNKEYEHWRLSPFNPYAGMSPAEWWHATQNGAPWPGKLSKEQFEQYLHERYN